LISGAGQEKRLTQTREPSAGGLFFDDENPVARHPEPRREDQR
jgi:hypothetical protein